MTWQLAPHAIPLFVAGAISAALFGYVLTRREVAGSRPLAVLMAGVAVWATAAAFEALAVPLAMKIFFANIEYVGIALVPTSWFVFAVHYTGRRELLTSGRLAALTIEPVLVVVAAWTDPWHSLMRATSAIDTASGYAIFVTDLGAAFWVHAAYSYVLLLFGTVMLLNGVTRSPHLYRGQVFAMVIGAAAPWVGNVLFLTGSIPALVFDPTPIGFTITGIAVAWAIFRFQLMDLVPVARGTVVENLDNAVVVLDAQNRIVDINPAAVDLFQVEGSVIGLPVRTLLPERAELVERYLPVLDVHEEVALELDDETVFYDLRISPLTGREGRVSGRLIVLHDITASKRNEEALRRAKEEAEEASHAKSRFLATMSHEIRTPLNGVVSAAELLLGTDLSADQRELAEVVETSGRTLMALINDILDFSKIEAGHEELESHRFELHEFVAKTTGMFRSKAEQKGLALGHEIGNAVPSWIVADETRLRQILVNLLGNAVKFTESGAVTLHVMNGSAGPGYLEFRVEDTGIGIPGEKLGLIFETFSQADSSTTRKYGGTGLGLAISRRLAELMGGHLRVESEQGEGSSFSLVVPVEISEAPSVAAAEGSEILAERLPLRILIVEDNPINQLTLRRMLERLGYDPELAEDGAVGVEMATATRYDLVFMDVQLPRMDGLEATRRIVGDLGHERPRIVAMTANATPEDRDACLDAGMDDYATKPISLGGLQAAIEKWGAV